MAKGPLSVPGAKATLFLSVLMTMMGTTGIVVGYVQVGVSPAPIEQDPSGPRMPDALLQEAQALQDEIRASTVPQAVGAANLVVSALLVIASFLLTGRRKSALWWTQQAILANVLYSIGAGAAQLWQLHAYGDRLALLVIATAEQDPQIGPDQAQSLSALPAVGVCLAVAIPLGLCVFYYLLLRLSRRESVVAFVTRETA